MANRLSNRDALNCATYSFYRLPGKRFLQAKMSARDLYSGAGRVIDNVIVKHKCFIYKEVVS